MPSAVEKGLGNPRASGSPSSPLKGEARWSFIVAEFSLDELPPLLDPLLPQLSIQIKTQLAKAAGRVDLQAFLCRAPALDQPQDSSREVLPGPSGSGA